jgi:hypothetical protein
MQVMMWFHAVMQAAVVAAASAAACAYPRHAKQ